MNDQLLTMWGKAINKRLRFLIVALLLGIAAWGIQQAVIEQPAAQAQADFSCTNVSQIPQSDCEVLVAIYNANAVDWGIWLTTNNPCSWDGVVCRDGRVYMLRVGEFQLTNLPPEIGNLSALSELDVSGNLLTSLPPEIGNLPFLAKLDVSDNQLTSLLPEIGNLTFLLILDVYNNSLTSLPPEIGNLTGLWVLNVSGNLLTSLPPEIGNMSYLRTIYSSGNPAVIQPVKLFTSSSPSSDSGTVERSMPGPFYARGSSVQLTATPATGWLFDSWDGPSGALTDSTISVAMGQEDQTYTAYFVEEEAGFSCANVSQIPQSECKALVAIHDANAVDWGNWLTSDTPCLWGDIACGNGHVIGLFLEQKGLTSLPAEIGDLLYLNHLDLSDNQLTSLPPAIGNLSFSSAYGSSLLDLSDNQLTNLPLEIGNLTFLTNLKVDFNQLTSLPAEIGNLTNLFQLSVPFNRLTSLPPEIGTLSELRTLDVSYNGLESIPSEIGNLTNLDQLVAVSNGLTSLPSEIGNLTNLTELYLRYNNLDRLPAEIGYMVSLNVVETSNNSADIQPMMLFTSSSPSAESGTVERSMPGPFYAQESLVELTAVPATDWLFDYWEGPNGTLTDAIISITIGQEDQTYTAYFAEEDASFSCADVSQITEGQCEALVAIYNANPLVDWGDWLTTNEPCAWENLACDLRTIAVLDLTEKGITSLPAEIGDLYNLQDLGLAKNQLTSLPSEIGNLTSLITLNLSENELTTLPSEIGNLTSLMLLNLSRNELTSLPSRIGDLFSLNSLDLSYNGLESLPPEIGNLRALFTLSVPFTRLAALPPEIGNLESLSTLDVSYNGLESLPSEIGNLTMLSKLIAVSNGLTSLPFEIGNLTNLTELYLRYNNLDRLPAEIGYMVSLSVVETSNNSADIQPVMLFTSSSPSAESGTVERSMPGPFYARGSSVQLTAVPAIGWIFDHWEGPQVSVEQSAQETITIVAGSDDESYEAYFVEESDLLGDVNCSDNLDVFDVIDILQYSNGMFSDGGSCPLTNENTLNVAAGDVNNSGSTDGEDALIVLQCVIGMPNMLCPVMNAADIIATDIIAADHNVLIEEAKDMLREKGLWDDTTVDLYIPFMMK